MKSGYITLVSNLHDNEALFKRIGKYQNILEKADVKSVEIKKISEVNALFVLIGSGGTEEKFIELFPEITKFKIPFCIISMLSDNSLPASMEIVSWLQANDDKLFYGLLHCPPENFAFPLTEHKIVLEAMLKMEKAKIGVIGKPSDWLISSNVDYERVTDERGTKFELIEMEEFEEIINTTKLGNDESVISDKLKEAFDKSEKDEAELIIPKKIYSALKYIISKYQLDGITLRCFDILDKFKSTGCLPLSQLNDEEIPAGCEGDVPAIYSMMVANSLGIGPAFMANPSEVSLNNVVFAHCTAPCRIVKNFYVTSHFESGIGLAIGGVINPGPVTIFKIGGKALSDAVVLEGQIELTEHSPFLCRTQVNIKLEDTSYFLKYPIGNHQIIIPGHHKDLLNRFCSNLDIQMR